MASDEPGIQKGGVIAFRATIGAPFRAAIAIISLSGVNGPRLVCTVRADQGIISVICKPIVTAIQSASSVRGVRWRPEGGRIRGQPPLIVIHGGRRGRADGWVEYILQNGQQTTL